MGYNPCLCQPLMEPRHTDLSSIFNAQIRASVSIEARNALDRVAWRQPRRCDDNVVDWFSADA